MADLMPDTLGRMHEAVVQTVDQHRASLRAAVGAGSPSGRFDPQKVADLHQLAVAQPRSRELAEFLCQLVPAQFLTLESVVLQMGAPSAEAGPAAAAGGDPVKTQRLEKLRAAVLEAALAEQLTPDFKVREGDALSAAKLEHSLDEWVRAGRHRGAEFADAPLSLIAKTIEATEATPEGQMMTRFGLVMPVLMAVHVWRMLEELEPAHALAAGWSAATSSPTDNVTCEAAAQPR